MTYYLLHMLSNTNITPELLINVRELITINPGQLEQRPVLLKIIQRSEP